MNKTVPALLVSGIFILASQFSSAGSAAWNLNPTSGDWNTAANWTPMTVPNQSTDVATFALSDTTDVSLSATVFLDSLVFSPGASEFNLNAGSGHSLLFFG